MKGSLPARTITGVGTLLPHRSPLQLPFRRLAWAGSGLVADRSGNALPMIGAVFLPLLALVGAGVDMARVYLSENRLQQACDAGVLAARRNIDQNATDERLPAEAMLMGRSLFFSNFRNGDYGAARVVFSLYVSPNRTVSGYASALIPTTIMQIFGTRATRINTTCSAQISASAHNLDIMLVLDTTGSMNSQVKGEVKISTLRNVVKAFHRQLEAEKLPGMRIRFGFVPYATNVNVAFLLRNEWVASKGLYQSREAVDDTSGTPVEETTYGNYTYVSGSMDDEVDSTYPATHQGNTYACTGNTPNGNVKTTATRLSERRYTANPPATVVTVWRMRRVLDGTAYRTVRDGLICKVYRTAYSDYTEDYDQTMTNAYPKQWRYAQIMLDTNNWRSYSNGCIEERTTYEIDDYANLDLSRAPDLDIDLVPSANRPQTLWKPSLPQQTYDRKTPFDVVTTRDIAPVSASCPTAARKLAEMTSNEVADYVDSLVPDGNTYHDIGLIWGGRLLSPTGLFASENADQPSRGTDRHLIFLTDGDTVTHPGNYTAYGIEGLDRRRFNPDGPKLGLTLNEVVERRFIAACNEIKKRNITVWTISFGLNIGQPMVECAGADRAFSASDARELQAIFDQIGQTIGDLRLVE